jgi:hypothetical protein
MPHLDRFAATLTVAVMSVSDRLRSVARGDRGDNPVSTAIIVAVLAAAAVAVAVAIKQIADNWVGRLNTEGSTTIP